MRVFLEDTMLGKKLSAIFCKPDSSGQRYIWIQENNVVIAISVKEWGNNHDVMKCQLRHKLHCRPLINGQWILLALSVHQENELVHIISSLLQIT